MKNLTVFIAITLAMLTTWGCKMQTSEVQQENSNAQDVKEAIVAPVAADNGNTDENRAANDSDAQKGSGIADEKADSQNAQPSAEIGDSELDQILAQQQEIPDEYIEIAD